MTAGARPRRHERSRLRGTLTIAALAGTTLLAAHTSAEPSELDPTVGYNYSEIETARHVATGGAQRALSASIGALFANPANIAVERVYHLGAFAQIWPEARRQSYGAAASDSIVSSSRMAGAAGVTYNIQDPDGVDRTWTDARFALAFPFSERLFVGLGGRYVWLNQDGLGPLGDSNVSSGLRDESIVQNFSFDAGATLKPTPNVAIAVVGSNLTNPEHGFLPTSFGGGIGFGQKQFAVEADVVADFTTWDETRIRAMGGVELLAAEHYGIRGGYRYDEGADSHALSLGFGYIDREFMVDVGARRVVSGDAATTIVLGFTYHLEASGLTPGPGDTF